MNFLQQKREKLALNNEIAISDFIFIDISLFYVVLFVSNLCYV
ncbi:hypothetical protein PROPEN_00158 [Proteus penneri ATCC 35198]|nr:hypothetical protein PROPEN_00158 [Proteus penneri ATCC 35198]